MPLPALADAAGPSAVAGAVVSAPGSTFAAGSAEVGGVAVGSDGATAGCAAAPRDGAGSGDTAGSAGCASIGAASAGVSGRAFEVFPRPIAYDAANPRRSPPTTSTADPANERRGLTSLM